MAFCPYCGKQLEAGEVCSCATGNVQPPAPSYIGGPRPSAPRPAGARPAAPRPAGYPAAAPQQAPQQAPYAPMPEQSFFEREEAPLPRSERAAESADERSYDRSYAPRRENDYFDSGDDFYTQPAAPQSRPQGGFPQEDDYAPVPPAARPTQTSGFTSDLNELFARVTKLFRGSSDEALKESTESEGTSWLAVFGAYILFGTLAACFAVPRFLADVASDFIEGLLGSFGSGVIKYGDILSGSFGGLLWRSLLVNILTIGIVFAAILGIVRFNKSKLPVTGALNLAGIAFVPAAALNVLGFLFSFFFPVGTLLCGIISAVCTVVIVLTALSDYCGKRGLWVNIIAVCVMLVVYVLFTLLLMDGFLPDLFSGGSGSGSYMPF